MKIIIINGSPRVHGNTGTVCKKTMAVLKTFPGIEVELVNLSTLNLGMCKGCGSCFARPGCVIRDEGDNLSTRIGESDGIIFASPVYASNVSGIMKNFIDRGHFVLEQLLYDKYYLNLVTYENAGASDALKVLSKLGLYSGGIGLGGMKFLVDERGEISNRDKLMRRLEKKLTAFHLALAESKKAGIFQRLVRRAIRDIGIRPFLSGHGRYAGVWARWKEMGWIN